METESFEDILVYFSKSLMGKENEEDILWDLAKNCISKLGFVDCVIYLVDEKNNLLVQKSAYGPKNPRDQKLHNPVKIPLGEGITGTVALTGVPEIVSDTSIDSRYIVDDALRLSEICVPISYEKVIYGVIDCEHPEKSFFNEQHLKMLSVIASICAIKIKSVRANVALIEKQQNLLRIKEEMVELKLKALNSQLHPHFVFNVINAIQYFVTSENKKSALDYLSLFSKLLRFNLKYLELDTVSLKDEIEMLNWYLKLQMLRYDNQFEYEITVDEDSKKLNAVIPASVTLTLFENLIEFAMYNQHKNEKLNVAFTISELYVHLKIQYIHDAIISAVEYKPKYRTHVMKWEDQIDLLNAAKNYNIKKEITSSKNKGKEIGEITVRLPNLISD
ncbi:histidine kinase [Flagellimonas meridianipacifica]|uniref:GAF domain-containing protein n=1 Tax=Flagellimonas meridianipacifica TaxID=1080225 RepID=A0A2T0MHE0_9FLAO|nr:sensor histidine kinase [Allomuricauda pacifica]PRX56999.1 GAF domain-containing protein [Allomuricauda pacifica]